MIECEECGCYVYGDETRNCPECGIDLCLDCYQSHVKRCMYGIEEDIIDNEKDFKCPN